MTEFISRNYGKEGYEIIIKTDSHEHYRATEDFARRLIDHAKPATNADKIRAMSDEELAKVLNAFTAYFEECNRSCSDVDCHDCELCELCSLGEGKAIDWLQQPSDEGE